MKKLIAVLLFASTAAFAVEEAELAKGLVNLAWMHQLAQAIEFRQAMGTMAAVPPSANDPWGTPYRVELQTEGYRIISAGSDKVFDEPSWISERQFANLEGDAIFANGRVVRSNRNWLATSLTGKPSAALQVLRDAEVQFMVMRSAAMKTVTAMRLTEAAITNFAQSMKSTAGATPPRDAWGTPLRLETEGTSYKIVSAGSDRKFEPETWTAPSTNDPSQDVVYENGAFSRRMDELKYVGSGVPGAVLSIAQPVDPPRNDETIARVGGDVKAPVVVTRVDPVYPEEYRKLRLSGITIVETRIGATGEVQDVRVLKSVAPEFDLAAMNAVRQWKFQPATRDGVAIPVLFNLTINFKLN